MNSYFCEIVTSLLRAPHNDGGLNGLTMTSGQRALMLADGDIDFAMMYEINK